MQRVTVKTAMNEEAVDLVQAERQRRLLSDALLAMRDAGDLVPQSLDDADLCYPCHTRPDARRFDSFPFCSRLKSYKSSLVGARSMRRWAAPVHPKAMPVLLTGPDEWARWLTVPAEEALTLQRPLPDGELKVVAAGQQRDEAAA